MREFNYIKRSGELIAKGYSTEEIAQILEKEESESDITVLDDGLWASVLEDVKREAEEELVAEGVLSGE